MKNKLDKQYTDLLQDILDNGVTKTDRTGTGTLSIFGRQIRHDMKDGFPLLTTKKMPLKTVMVELIWFLRGDTNIKYLLDNNCHIWDGDCYKHYKSKKEETYRKMSENPVLDIQPLEILSFEKFIDKIKNDEKFCKEWGDLGPIYGKQWRDWRLGPKINEETGEMFLGYRYIDQIRNLINDLKNNPDSRRLMVNAWNVGELDGMTLPPCHYGFQCYTRELSLEERIELAKGKVVPLLGSKVDSYDEAGIPTRALSLMWNQRSVDTFLGLPFNIASYGLLLTILAELTNMVPDQLIGNLGDTHLYLNHLDQAKEQIGRDLSFAEREAMYPNYMDIVTPEMIKCEEGMGQWYITNAKGLDQYAAFIGKKKILQSLGVPERTREPFELPRLNINTEFWLTESGECGVGLLSADGFLEGLKDENFCTCLINDIELIDYKSHQTIKAPLSN